MTIVFIDSETRSALDVGEVGAHKYTAHHSTSTLCFAYAVDDKAVTVIREKPGPRVVRELNKLIKDGARFVAHNATFDRLWWNVVLREECPKIDPIPLNQWYCSAALARTYNHPSKLKTLAMALGLANLKDDRGRLALRKLADANKPMPEDEEHWRGVLEEYCAADVAAMREAWGRFPPLPDWVWRLYDVSEAINDRGFGFDERFAVVACELLERELAEVNADLAEITGDPGMTLAHHVRKSRWLAGQFADVPEALALVTEVKDDSTIKTVLDNATQEKVGRWLDDPDNAALLPPETLARVTRFLDALSRGSGAASLKFRAGLLRSDGGRIRGAYMFAGAGQTWRFSANGFQPHNLIRDKLDDPDATMAGLMNGAVEDVLAREKLPLNETLGRCLRPSIKSAPRHQLVWFDLAGIEARGLPYLAGPSGKTRLDEIKAGVDFYIRTARLLYPGRKIEGKEAPERQHGKVVELACQYGGGVGALVTMGRQYGVSLSQEIMESAVRVYRENNLWATGFWYALTDAVRGAYQAPGTRVKAGLVTYLYVPNLLGGTMACRLPSGHAIYYPHFKIAQKKDEESKRWREVMTYRRQENGQFLTRTAWHGTFAENVTQAFCADLFMYFLRRFEEEGLDVVLHTHDEIVVETRNYEAATARGIEIMTQPPPWAAGIPLKVEAGCGERYGK